MKRWVCFCLLLLWIGWHLAQPIQLASADIGRHIKNGELLLSGVTDILYKNYYSYTHPDYSFINHHWFFGVMSYWIWRCVDFVGLSFVYILLQLLTFSLFFGLARRHGSFGLACAFALWSIPLISYRCEIRPEGVSMLMCGLFWWLLQKHQLKNRRMWIVLCILQVVWVNTHIFFLMGPLLTGLFWWQAKINQDKEQADFLKQAFGITCLASCINPSGIAGALVPLNIFKGFGYDLVENQSILFMMQNFTQDRLYAYFFVTCGLMMVPWMFLIRREGLKKHVGVIVLSLLVLLCAIKGARMLGAYGYFWISLTVYGWGRWMQAWPLARKEQVTGLLLIVGIIVSVGINFNWQQKPRIGLSAQVNESAEFFKKHQIKGPIFNNYDLGGYLIFHLSPQMKLFTDNRHEAFPSRFFRDELTPMEFSEEVWHQKEDQYHFNTIYFSRNPWERQFLSKRFHDPTWSLVYLDDYAAILLKRNIQNRKTIEQFEWKRK